MAPRLDPLSNARLDSSSNANHGSEHPSAHSRRSFSDIIVPPQLVYSDQPQWREDDGSSASSDSGAEGYRDLDEDEEDEKALLAEEGAALEGNAHWAEVRMAQLRRKRLLFTLPLGLAVFTLLVTFLASQLFSGRHTFKGEGLKKITMEHLANGTFAVDRQSLNWLAEAGDGVYSYRTDDGSIMLVDVDKNATRALVNGEDVRDETGRQLLWQTFKVSADLKYIIFGADRTKQWRHSSNSNFYVHEIGTGRTTGLLPPSSAPHTATASFSPKDHHLAYVYANDLYVLESPPDQNDGKSAIRITIDGSPTTFNGVPDWVYEEEVFSADSATWWSPDGSKVAFLSFEEHDVPEYEFPVYNPSPWAPGADPYPTATIMRYPKPGFPNPKVQIHVFNLGRYLDSPLRPSLPTDDATKPELDPRVLASTYDLVFSAPFEEDNTIIGEVTWVGANELMVKATDRIAKVQRVAHFVLGEVREEREVVGKVVREDDYGAIDGGWVEPGQTIVGIDSTVLLHFKATGDAAPIPTYPPGYLDLAPDSEGFNHIAFFSPPDAKDPVFLTTGEWEVDGNIEAVDIARGLVYFIAANPSIERHLYSVPLPSREYLAALKGGDKPQPPTVLTDTAARGYHSTSFSPFGGFYVLSYQGPKIPWQRLVKVDDKEFLDVLADNAELALVDAQFQKAEVIYKTVESEGFELNVVELRPPQMDFSGRTKYPLLFQVYGGPASQKVSTTFSRDWHHYLCTSLGYVVVTVDPRGTGFRGRKFRMPVRDRLGELEAGDVVNAAQHYMGLPYIDEKRVGIWGWSYGGYLTSKVIETNSSVFTLGMAVAPVTDWRYYDTIYTERYMSTPSLNLDGYEKSAVTKMEGFANADFLLAHGSGDDNVHFLNTAALLDRLTSAHVRGFRFRMFTDSDHSMQMRGAYWELMNWLTDFLTEKWGEGGRTKQRWKMEKTEDTAKE